MKRHLLIFLKIILYTFATLLAQTAHAFGDNGDGTYTSPGLTANSPGLMWQICAVGETYTPGWGCAGNSGDYTYYQAISLTSNLAGYSDWRLPTIDEYKVVLSKISTVFPYYRNRQYSMYWSSTTYTGHVNLMVSPSGEEAYVASFYGGYSTTWDRSDGLGVHLVRNDTDTGTVVNQIVKPNAPINVRAIALKTRVKLQWSDNSNNESGFQIMKWNGRAWINLANIKANSTASTVTKLKSNTTYYFSVCAYNNAGSSCPTNYITVTTTF